LQRVKERAESQANSGSVSQQPGSPNPKIPKEEL
jgi:hypothetical protein